MSYQARLHTLRNVLEQDAIPLEALRDIAAQGIPDEGHLRPLCWRILLDYLPLQRRAWEAHVAKQRSCYAQLVADLIVHPGPTPSDHPLSESEGSEWSAFFKDNEVLLQIDKDCRRLCPELSFFGQATSFPRREVLESGLGSLSERVAQSLLQAQDLTTDRSGKTNLVTSRKVASDEYSSLKEEKAEAHWEVVQRVLFIYAKLNPGVKYIQGMNELIGPLYYTFATDAAEEWRAEAEADTFFCFQNLMSEVKDQFIKSLDGTSVGIDQSMSSLYALVESRDPVLHDFLVQEQEIRPQFFAFRWISLLLSQEFLLPDVIRLWDTLFADAKRFEFLQFFCCAMLVSVREELLASDFGSNMKLLQNFPPTDMGGLVELGEKLQDPAFRVSERKSTEGGRGARIREENSKFWRNLSRNIKTRINNAANNNST